MSEDRAGYLALALTPGIGPARFTRLVRAFGSPRGALEAPFALLGTVPGISRACATAVTNQSPDVGAKALEEVAALGGACLLPDDDAFPLVLRTVPAPPLYLFVLGDVSLCDREALAVVGSRDHSEYGAAVTAALAGAAAAAGIVVVSGMARGLDAVAHDAALAAGGGTIGVLGNGLGVVYPAANRRLYAEVERRGLLVSEFPPGERPQVGSFPRRNRLISGLAKVTVVVEAAAGSGTLITVDAALEQGRDVMAVPGPITSATSVGTNRLIRDGATPVLTPEDVLQHYGVSVSPSPRPPTGPAGPDLDPEDRRLLDALGGEPVHVDVLAQTVSQPVAQVLDRLCELELAGWVLQRPGRLFLAGDGGMARGNLAAGRTGDA